MKKTDEGRRAHEYEHLMAPAYKDGFANRKFYAVEGLAGLWRRLPAPKKGEAVPEGAMKVVFGGKFAYVKLDDKATAEVSEGGYDSKSPAAVSFTKSGEEPAVEVQIDESGNDVIASEEMPAETEIDYEVGGDADPDGPPDDIPADDPPDAPE